MWNRLLSVAIAKLGALLFRTRVTRLYTHMHTHTNTRQKLICVLWASHMAAAVPWSCLVISRSHAERQQNDSQRILVFVCVSFEFFVCRILLWLCRERYVADVCVCVCVFAFGTSDACEYHLQNALHAYIIFGRARLKVTAHFNLDTLKSTSANNHTCV